MVRNLTPRFRKVIKDILRGSLDYPYRIAKEELLSFSNEERRFIGKHISKYWRGSYRLKPRSFTHFLIDKKYTKDDTVEVWVTLDNLVDEGILTLVEKDGFKYWSLGGEILDPREYNKIYKLKPETYPALLREYGYLDIYERFKDEINKSEIIHQEELARFIYNGIEFKLYPGKLSAYTSVGYELPEKEFEYGTGIGRDKNFSLWMFIDNPKAEDIDKIVELVRKIDEEAREKVDFLKNYVEKETGITVEREKFWGTITVKNYKITEFYASLGKTVEQGRKRIEIILRRDFAKKTFGVELKGVIKSYYVAKAFEDINPEELGIEVPENYSLYVRRMDREVVLGYKFYDKNLDKLPSIGEQYNLVSSIEAILRELLKLHLESIRDKKIIEYQEYEERYTGFTVGDVIDTLDWSQHQSYELIVLKLIAAKLELPKKTNVPLYDYLVAWAVLEGYDQDKLTNDVNNMLETVIEYMRKGRVKLVHNRKAGAYVLYVDNKPSGIEIYKLSKFIRMLITAKTLLKTEEEAFPRKRILVRT